MEIESLFSEEMEPPAAEWLDRLEKAAQDLILPRTRSAPRPSFRSVRPASLRFTDSRRHRSSASGLSGVPGRLADGRWQLKNRISDHESWAGWSALRGRANAMTSGGAPSVAITPY